MSTATKGATSPRFVTDVVGTAHVGTCFIKFADLTRHGVDVAEYTVDCEPGIARPAKYLLTRTNIP